MTSFTYTEGIRWLAESGSMNSLFKSSVPGASPGASATSITYPCQVVLFPASSPSSGTLLVTHELLFGHSV